MTLYDFAMLSFEEQADLTWKHGAFIAVGNKGPIKVLLYQVGSFYVEVYYNSEKVMIEQFRCFSSTDQLEPYLAAIDLSELAPVMRCRPQAVPSLRTKVWNRLSRLLCSSK